MGKIIGIDLGTSNSAASVMVGGKPTIIQAAEGTSVGGKAFPSYVAFTMDGQLLVGEPARRQMVTNPEGTVIAAKRKMGTDFKFKVYDKQYTPQQISSFILQKIKNVMLQNLGLSIALGGGASYHLWQYISPNIELQYRIKLTNGFSQSFLGLIGFECHSSLFHQGE